MPYLIYKNFDMGKDNGCRGAAISSGSAGVCIGDGGVSLDAEGIRILSVVSGVTDKKMPSQRKHCTTEPLRNGTTEGVKSFRSEEVKTNYNTRCGAQSDKRAGCDFCHSFHKAIQPMKAPTVS